jgi:hypothetical protein
MSGKNTNTNGLEESLLRVKQENLDTLIRTESAVLVGMKFDADSVLARAKRDPYIASAMRWLEASNKQDDGTLSLVQAIDSIDALLAEDALLENIEQEERELSKKLKSRREVGFLHAYVQGCLLRLRIFNTVRGST